MKYKILFAGFAVTIAAILFNGTFTAYGNVNGAPAGVTGSPSDGASCSKSGCHTGSAVTPVSGWITSNIPPGGYTPGATYTITATATYAGRTRFGFEISPQDANGNYLGTLVSTVATETQIISSKYITHKTAGTTGSGSRTWTFNWIAPSSGTGAVTFYGAFNCANNNTFDTGDLIYTSTLAVNEAPTPGLDCGIHDVISPLSNACDSTVTPVVQLENYGTTPLDSVVITYFTDANTPLSYTWYGPLATGASVNVTLPSVLVPALGAHTFTASTTLPNGSTDLVTNNDSKTVNFTVLFAGVTLPFSQGFESTSFPPAGWVRTNPDLLTTWARTTAAHSAGVASAYLNSYSYTQRGRIDELITPAIDLTTDAAPVLTFDVAYRLYTNPASNPNYSDTLSVFISTDCGASWQLLYKKFGTALTTITPAFSSAAFTPAAANWRQESVSLLPYATCKTAYLKFANTNGYQNRLYLDNIYINGPAAVFSTPEISSIELQPNPASDNIALNYLLKEDAAVSIRVYNLQGQIVESKIENEQQSAGIYAQVINVQSFPPGVYFMQLTVGHTVLSRKFVVTH